MKSIVLAILIGSFSLSGCFPARMSISDEHLRSVSPIALYVVACTEGNDNGDTVHRDYTIDVASDSIAALFGAKGYSVIRLNPLLPVSAAFDKYVGAFHIDEDTIASVARANGCSTFLILYYSYLGAWRRIDTTTLGRYDASSVRAWLGSSVDANIISSSKTPLKPYSGYKESAMRNHETFSERTMYGHFLASLAARMFTDIPLNPGPK
jgi:hypothetical protein